MRSKGFTIIELLVVIAIIAILAAILFPVFAQAKAAAKKAANISNLKQIGLAILQYNADYDDFMVPHSVSNLLQPQGTVWWHGRAVLLSGVPGYNVDYIHNEGLIYPYMKNVEIQDCPVGKSLPPQFSNWRNGHLSPAYGTNRNLFVSPSATVPAVSMSQVEEVATTMAMADAAGGITPSGPITLANLTKSNFISAPWSGTMDNGGGNTWFSPRLHGRHSGKACVLWADGHVNVKTPVYRPSGGNPRHDQRRALNLGELSRVPLPTLITASDPKIPEYNYYFSLNKAAGR